ncbi:MAG TPA: chemotaxis protein CheW, partial [Actinomycetales bacterium]
TSGARRGLTLVQCGEHVLAVDVRQVHTTLPSCLAAPSVLDSALCRGVMSYTGLEVAVVDPLVLLGLGALPAEARGPGLVLNLGRGFVVLALTSLLDIVDVAPAEVMPVPPFTVNRPALVDGVVLTDGEHPALVLNGPALLSDADLLALATMNVADNGARGDRPDDSSSVLRAGQGAVAPADAELGRPQLRFSVGLDLVSPLHQVSEILPLPSTLTRTNVQPFVLGIMSHRGEMVPVLCLRTLLGTTPAVPATSGCLLLVAVDGLHVAFAVDELQGMEPLTWRDDEDPGAPPTSAGEMPTLRTSPLVQVRGDSRLLPQLDLLAVARAVQPAQPAADVHDADAEEEHAA